MRRLNLFIVTELVEESRTPEYQLVFVLFSIFTEKKKKKTNSPPGNFPHVSEVTSLTRIHEDLSSIPCLTQWIKESGIAVSYGVGCRCGSDLVLTVVVV